MNKKADLYCEEITRKNSSTFYKAFKILNKKDQQAIYTIYAFCRVCDDIVDDQTTSNETKKANLITLKAQLKLIANNKYQGDDLILISLQNKFQQYHLDLTGFELLIEGQMQDLKKTTYLNLHELEKYCYLVASSVGLMINPILAPKNYQKLEPAAKIIGYALQLTNILRDVGEDFQKYQRIYLPIDLLEKHQLNKENLNHVTNEFKKVFEELANITENYYTQANSYLKQYPLKSRIVIFLMLRKYRKILNYIRANNYDVFTKFNQYGDGIEQ